MQNLPLGDDKEILEDILKVLHPLKVVTVLMQGEQYVTLSSVYPELCNVIYELEDMENGDNGVPLHPVVQAFAGKLVKAIMKRLSSTFLRPAALIATALDPRFKRLRLIDPRAHKDCLRYVFDAMKHETALDARAEAAIAAAEAVRVARAAAEA